MNKAATEGNGYGFVGATLHKNRRHLLFYHLIIFIATRHGIMSPSAI